MVIKYTILASVAYRMFVLYYRFYLVNRK